MGKTVPGTFVSHEDAAAYRLKIDQSNFFWKNLALRICVPMGAQNGYTMRFFSY